MAGDLDFGEDGGDAAFFVDDEGGAFDTNAYFAEVLLLLQHAVEFTDLTFAITEERVGEQ